MARITVEPTEFILVGYDAGEIRAIADDVASRVGFPESHPISIDVEESTPLTRAVLTSLTPLVVAVEGGAFEDPKRPRQLSKAATEVALARVLFQAHDRLLGGFPGVALEGITLAQQIAWDIHAYGRAERLGMAVQRQTRLYAFRSRHGFSDAADAVFDRLWNAASLTWADLLAACAETGADAAGRPA